MNFRIFIKKFLPTGNFTREFCIQDGFTGMKELTLVDPKLHMIQSASGSFECSFHKDSVVYKSNAEDGLPWVEMGKTRIVIRRYDNEYGRGTVMWEGRVLNVDTDFYGQEYIYAEGALSYLNDSIQPTKSYPISSQDYSGPGSIAILKLILAEHNAQCPDKRIEFQDPGKLKGLYPTEISDTIKQIDVGNETTMSAVSKMVSAFGGKMRIVYDENDVARLEWYKNGDEPVSTNVKISEIIFTKNMLDYQKKRDLTSLATYVYPRGYKAYSAGDYAVGDDMMKPTDGNEWSKVTWTTGAYIHAVSDQQGAVYEWVHNEQGYHDTMATGFWDSARGRALYPGHSSDELRRPGSSSLEVKPGEIYYITLIQSNGRTCYIVTANMLGNNPAYIIASQAASNVDYPLSQSEPDQYGQRSESYPTTWSYHKIQIPTDDKINDSLKQKNTDGTIKTDSDGNALYNYHFYLNVSSRGTFNEAGVSADLDGSYSYLFDGENRKVGIWKGRHIPIDEYITLKGLGNGTYDVFFVTIGNSSIPVKCKDQSGKDRAIKFPRSTKDKNPEPEEPKASKNDLPSIDTVAVFDVYRVASDEIPGGVTRYTKPQKPNPDTGLYEWEECVVDTIEGLTGKLIDPGMTFWVKSEQKWWVKYGESWYEQKSFHRDGFYLYNDETAAKYGRIAKFVDYSTVIDPDELEENGLSYLYASEFENLSLTVRAVDLGIIEPNNSISVPFNVLGQVRVTSTYHGISDKFFIQEIEYDFNNLGNTEIEVGYTKINRITENTKDFIKVG